MVIGAFFSEVGLKSIYLFEEFDLNAAAIKEYLAYIKHLKTNYPYLFSLACRTNPFNDETSPIVNN
ncbi:MAG: hypothetical protein KJ770_04105 [Actinobacteria bacterium]|nr:hypothetical protein [Actinomycetota bacterium]MCG2789653.1 hypothetical protein [Actinomycetes bacterium]